MRADRATVEVVAKILDEGPKGMYVVCRDSSVVVGMPGRIWVCRDEDGQEAIGPAEVSKYGVN